MYDVIRSSNCAFVTCDTIEIVKTLWKSLNVVDAKRSNDHTCNLPSYSYDNHFDTAYGCMNPIEAFSIHRG